MQPVRLKENPVQETVLAYPRFEYLEYKSCHSKNKTCNQSNKTCLGSSPF